jgi:hypothetical protein
MDGGGGKKKKAVGGKKKKAVGGKKKAAAPAMTILDRIRGGAKVHVSERGRMYIVYGGKKHTVPR